MGLSRGILTSMGRYGRPRSGFLSEVRVAFGGGHPSHFWREHVHTHKANLSRSMVQIIIRNLRPSLDKDSANFISQAPEFFDFMRITEMNASNRLNRPLPISGILSLSLSPLGLLLVIYFAAAGDWGIVHPRAIIVSAQYLLLSLLGSGLAAGIVGVARREQPQWLSVSGLISTICITTMIAVFFYALDD